MLNWVNRFNIFCLLDNRHYDFNKPAFECLLAAGSKANIEAQAGKAFDALRFFYAANKNEWHFGHFGYDLKNETEKLSSHNEDGIGFSDLHFFVPEVVIELIDKEVAIHTDGEAKLVFDEILKCPATITENIKSPVVVQNRISKANYIDIIEKLRQHILRGDCYEINFCQEFFAAAADIDPLYMYNRLTELSPNPFSALYKMNSRWCLSASPERYLKKEGNKIISQPIKGTSKRNLQNTAADEQAKNYLIESEKEKSENVMVVDLVRNDLSRICKAGSVKVDELFAVYSFPQVHQMISTVSGELEAGKDWIDCIEATFPMGSMTGAPKKKVMELIEQYEQTKRGLFSGAIGYVKPGGDFDFNVVIRSILYNAACKYLSFQTGGGITYNSNPVLEYEESLLKASAMIKVLE
ncbi:MAG: anthranilate synthase component I family protein [Chitinophagaceae bacterium]|nr:anthranilate synthase component I family protein [Chitinophagaceae bacterium]